jgi:hypothetical protein
MARLYISEYREMGAVQASKRDIAAPLEPAIVVQTPINITGASIQSEQFHEETRFVRLHTDATCSVRFGVNPVATTNDARMAAGSTEYFGVVPGHRVAVISNT